MERPFTNVQEKGEPVHDWVRQIDTANGERRWLSVNAAPLLSDDDVVEQVMITEEDIMQLKEQTRRLERQRGDLRKEFDEVITRIDDVLLALDANWWFTSVNECAEELLQQLHEDIHGMGI